MAEDGNDQVHAPAALTLEKEVGASTGRWANITDDVDAVANRIISIRNRTRVVQPTATLVTELLSGTITLYAFMQIRRAFWHVRTNISEECTDSVFRIYAR
jgi:hypothetical protein